MRTGTADASRLNERLETNLSLEAFNASVPSRRFLTPVDGKMGYALQRW